VDIDAASDVIALLVEWVYRRRLPPDTTMDQFFALHQIAMDWQMPALRRDLVQWYERTFDPFGSECVDHLQNTLSKCLEISAHEMVEMLAAALCNQQKVNWSDLASDLQSSSLVMGAFIGRDHFRDLRSKASHDHSVSAMSELPDVFFDAEMVSVEGHKFRYYKACLFAVIPDVAVSSSLRINLSSKCVGAFVDWIHTRSVENCVQVNVLQEILLYEPPKEIQPHWLEFRCKVAAFVDGQTSASTTSVVKLHRCIGSDVVLVARDGREHVAHWLALALCGTSHFINMRVSGMREAVDNRIDVDTSSRVLEIFLEWVYARDPPTIFRAENFLLLFDIARMWDVRPLLFSLMFSDEKSVQTSAEDICKIVSQSLKTEDLELCSAVVGRYTRRRRRHKFPRWGGLCWLELNMLTADELQMAHGMTIGQEVLRNKVGQFGGRDFEFEKFKVQSSWLEKFLYDAELNTTDGKSVRFYAASLLAVSKSAVNKFERSISNDCIHRSIRVRADRTSAEKFVEWLQFRTPRRVTENWGGRDLAVELGVTSF